MRQRYRTVGKWALRGILVVIFLGVLYVTILAVPTPLFEYTQRSEGFTFYFNHQPSEDLGEIASNARARIEAMEHAQPNARYRVFVCSDPRFYSLFATLTRRSPNSMAIGLSLFGNIYINEPKVRNVARNNPWGIRHSRFEGNLSEVITHEIAHFHVVKQMGFLASMQLPVWKSEGYAEYQANLAEIRADSSYVLSERIDLHQNSAVWGRKGSMARWLFETHLLVEYLAEVKGLSPEDLVDEGVTECATRAEMMTWHRTRQQY